MYIHIIFLILSTANMNIGSIPCESYLKRPIEIQALFSSCMQFEGSCEGNDEIFSPSTLYKKNSVDPK